MIYLNLPSIFRPYFLTLYCSLEEGDTITRDRCVRCKVFWWVNTTLKSATVSGRSQDLILSEAYKIVLIQYSNCAQVSFHRMINRIGSGTNSVTVLEEPRHGQFLIRLIEVFCNTPFKASLCVFFSLDSFFAGGMIALWFVLNW
jgi:hypothetical protein